MKSIEIKGKKITLSNKQIEVSEEIFNISIQENHNYLNEDLITELRDMRTPEEITEEEKLAKFPSQEEVLKMKIELILINMLEEGGVV